MLPYLLNITLISFIGLLAKKKNNNILILVFVLIILVAISGLRGSSVGTDTNTYIGIFENIPRNFQIDSMLNHHVEPLYFLLNWWIKFMNGSSLTLLILTSFIVNFFVIRSILEHSKDKFFSIFLYVGLYHFYQSFNGIRQYIAVSLVLFSYKYVKSKEFSKFIILILIASGFHITALIFIPFYFIYNRMISFKTLIGFTILVFIFIISFNELLSIVFNYFPQYQFYENTIAQSSSGNRDIVLSFSFIFLGGMFGNLKSKSHLYLTMIAITYFAFSILTLFYDANLIMRLGWYFSIFMIIYIPNTLMFINNDKLRRLLKYIIFCCVFSLHLYLLSVNFHQVTPYEFYLIP